jgi:CRP-like cAMP-binding protein
MGNFLKNLNIFEWFWEAHLDIILEKWKIISFKKGEVLIKQWDRDECFYVLQSGIVSVFKEDTLQNTIFEWDIFWEISLVTSEPRTATIIAETDGVAIMFEKKSLFEMIKKFDTQNTIQKTIINRIIMNHKK